MANCRGGEKEAMRQFLAFYGSLGEGGVYRPDGRSGMDPLPGGYRETGQPVARALSAADLRAIGPTAGFPIVFEDIFDMQAPMFQPVGGMDRIAHAIYERVRAEGPSATARSPRSGGAAPGCASTMGPATGRSTPIIASAPCRSTCCGRIPADFSPAKQAAIRDNPYLASTKVGFESPRFWEEEGIYGGLAWTDRANENLFYPSGGWHAPSGVLVTAYASGWTGQNHPAEFMAMSHEERFRLCRDSVEALHPGQVPAARPPGHNRLAAHPLVRRRRTRRSGLWRRAAGRRADRRSMRNCCDPKARSSSPASISPTCRSGRKVRLCPPMPRCAC